MSENTNLGLTIEAWADIVIERWETKIERLRIGNTGNLAKSFYQHVQTQANGNPELIIFTFEYYGKFVDMGVGRGVPLSQVEFSYRRPKPWYSKVFFSQLEKLKDILADKYGQKAQFAIITNVEKFNEEGSKLSDSHKKRDLSDRNRNPTAREYDRLHGN